MAGSSIRAEICTRPKAIVLALSLMLGDDGVRRGAVRSRHLASSPGDSRYPWKFGGGGYESKVTAGENRGETLHHEFVALALADAPDYGKYCCAG